MSKQVKPTKGTANLVKQASADIIELLGVDGEPFTARFAPITAARMESLLRVSAKYTDPDLMVQQTLDAIALMPELKESIPDYDRIKPFLDGLKDDDYEKKKILARILTGGGLTAIQLADNLTVLRNYVRIMILETTLEPEQLDCVKSELDSEFWDLQDLEVIKSAGEFFRRKVTDYSK